MSVNYTNTVSTKTIYETSYLFIYYDIYSIYMLVN